MAADHYISIDELMGALPSGDGRVGLDLEADSLYRYAERICLVQVCYGKEVKLIDPLAEESLDPLVDWLGSARIWMHGADYHIWSCWKEVPPQRMPLLMPTVVRRRWGLQRSSEQIPERTTTRSTKRTSLRME